ncbi:hypothetical protein OG21DRAFT_1522520 [Imleria badia]|nr:hypothetical protein OG21DRAFT_1522520 [Imleria badia]
MSFTTFEDILALSEVSDVDAKTAEVEKQLVSIKHVAPDNKEELAEEKADWCNEWQGLLVQSVLSDDGATKKAEKVSEALMTDLSEDNVAEGPPMSMTSSEAKEAETMPSESDSGRKQKRAACRIVADEGEEEEDVVEIIETGPQEDLDNVLHDPPCTALHISCNKLKGRSWKGKAVVSEAKGKATVRSTVLVVIPPLKIGSGMSNASACPKRTTATTRPLIDSPPTPEYVELDEDSHDETPWKRLKTTGPSGPSPMVVADVKCVVLTIESKLLTTQGYLKDLEARVSATEAHVTSQQDNLERVKAVLRML